MVSKNDNSIPFSVLIYMFMKTFSKTENINLEHKIKFSQSNMKETFNLSLLLAIGFLGLFIALKFNILLISLLSILIILLVSPFFIKSLMVKIKAIYEIKKYYSFEYLFLKQFNIDLLNPFWKNEKEIRCFIQLCKDLINDGKEQVKHYKNNFINQEHTKENFINSLNLLELALINFENSVSYQKIGCLKEFHSQPGFKKIFLLVRALKNFLDCGVSSNLQDFIISFDETDNNSSIKSYIPETSTDSDILIRNKLLLTLIRK